MRWMLPLLALLLQLAGATASGADEWSLARRDDARDIRVYVRPMPGSTYKRFYAITRVQARLSTVVSALSDVSAMPEWIARMRSAQVVRREANREIWVHTIYRLPYPFLEREAVLHSTLHQDSTGVVEVSTRAEPGMVPPHPHRVRLLNLRSLWRLTPESNGMVKIELWGEGDPGGYVPHLLFNYNLPDEPAQTLRNFRHLLPREKYRTRTLDFLHDA
ncbi:MAG TPA: START domain-containing protein [Moraxellaceae bacterium]|nr:START domain-containing protein [Moraxellaceae bacterium]